MNPLEALIGKAVLIRTVTHYQLGTLAGVDTQFLTLTDACWVADTGRWSKALKTGVLTEVEMFVGTVYVAVGAVVDLTSWEHDLPTVSK